MAHVAPGKAHRSGITLMQLADMFPDEEAARKWFESRIWPDGRHCPRCKGTRTREASDERQAPASLRGGLRRGRHGMRESDTLEQIGRVVRGMVGKRLPYKTPGAGNEQGNVNLSL